MFDNVKIFESVKGLIASQCNGLIGALRLSALKLRSVFPIKELPKEEDVLQFVLSHDFVEFMARAFGSAHTYPIRENYVTFLKKVFSGEVQLHPLDLHDDDARHFLFLQKSGILIDDEGLIKFASALAKRYFARWLFPGRSTKEPESLRKLIESAISSMSASLLEKSLAPGSNFANEATFQHMMMRGLTENTTPNCAICPDLSKIYPDEQDDDGICLFVYLFICF